MSKSEFKELVKTNRKSIIGTFAYIGLFIAIFVLGSMAFYW